LADLLRAAVEVAEVRLRAGDELAVAAHQDAHHAVRGGVLRPEVHFEVGRADVEEVLALSRREDPRLLPDRHAPLSFGHRATRRRSRGTPSGTRSPSEADTRSSRPGAGCAADRDGRRT